MSALTFHVERGDDELTLDVTYRVNRYYPATHWQPAEGGDCKIISVLLNGMEFDITQAEEDRLQQYCIQDAAERAEEAAERRAEMLRDDRMGASK
jgi:hypothetical protein